MYSKDDAGCYLVSTHFENVPFEKVISSSATSAQV